MPFASFVLVGGEVKLGGGGGKNGGVEGGRLESKAWCD